MTIAEDLERLAARVDRWSPGCGPRKSGDAWRLSCRSWRGDDRAVLVRRPDVRAVEIGCDVGLLCLAVDGETMTPTITGDDHEVWRGCSSAMRSAIRSQKSAYAHHRTIDALTSRGIIGENNTWTPLGVRLHRYARGPRSWPMMILDTVGMECPCCEGSGDFDPDPRPGCLNCDSTGSVLVDEFARDELLVQADRLQAEGDPRGEWLALYLTGAACGGNGQGCATTRRAFKRCYWCASIGTALAERHRDMVRHLDAKAAAA